jgi:hypothetical protein
LFHSPTVSHMSMSQCLLALLNGRRRAVVRWLYEYSKRVATFSGVSLEHFAVCQGLLVTSCSFHFTDTIEFSRQIVEQGGICLPGVPCSTKYLSRWLVQQAIRNSGGLPSASLHRETVKNLLPYPEGYFYSGWSFSAKPSFPIKTADNAKGQRCDELAFSSSSMLSKLWPHQIAKPWAK